MTKNKVLIITAVLAAAMLTACGESISSEPSETTSLVSVDVEETNSETTVEETETDTAQSETSAEESAPTADDIEMPQPFETQGDGDINDGFYLPFNSILNNIPIELMGLRSSEDVDGWLSYSSQSEKTDLNSYQNLYSFITAFDITKEEAETALAPYIENGTITAEQLETLCTDSAEKVTNAFASDYSIVVGDKIYCPSWIYNHSVNDYTAVGITAEAVKEKAPLYSELGLSEEASAAFSAKLSEFVGEEIAIEPLKNDESEMSETADIPEDNGVEVEE